MNNEEIYSNLPKENKKLIQMYFAAQQFKNAIEIDEIVTIPAKRIGLPENSILEFKGVANIQCKGDKMVIKAFPFVVNKSFACEIYLKLLLCINGEEIAKVHTLGSLFSKLDNSNQCKIIDKIYGKHEDEQIVEFKLNLEQVSDAFEKWRYIYEECDKKNIIGHGFLNIFCDALNEFCANSIKEKYNYDV